MRWCTRYAAAARLPKEKARPSPVSRAVPCVCSVADDAARAYDRLDDHPAKRIGGLLARVAGVCRDQEQRLADDRRRQATQRRRDQARGRRPRRRRRTRSCRQSAGRGRRKPSPRARRRSAKPGRARRCRGTVAAWPGAVIRDSLGTSESATGVAASAIGRK